MFQAFQLLKQSCIELGSCSFTDFFDWSFYPYRLQFGEGWGYMIIWGIVIGVIWLRSRNFMMTVLVGILVGGFLFAGPAIVEASRGFQMAAIAVAVAIGVALYILYKYRLNNPQ